jgi:hypothetical protein
MNKQTFARMLVAGSVAAAGLTLGGIGLASAEDQSPAPGARHLMLGPHGADLAEELGVSDAQLQAAMAAVHDELKPPTRPADGERPMRPTSQEIADHQSQLASALAKELGLSEPRVAAALEKVHAQARADHRDELTSRLDAAIKSGDLTPADRASVLKAFDADVLGGPFGGRPGGR